MDKNNESDEELMRKLQLNDLSAFELLYERHQSRLYNYFQARSPKYAEDLFQECFSRLLERRDQWNGQPFLAWFFVMARNLFIDEFRKSKIQKTEELSDWAENEKVEIDQWLEGISDESKTMLKEHYLSGLSYQEMSQKYGTKEASLRQKLSRALQVLRKELT
ncbi:MAG: RNA polymerase sigma factor [Bacteriovoracaceae bacterium]|nr:RNA polymerase sigma factor [Bacteriovoracaceae bacterium]